MHPVSTKSFIDLKYIVDSYRRCSFRTGANTSMKIKLWDIYRVNDNHDIYVFTYM